MTKDRSADDGNAPHKNHKKHEKLYHWVYVFGVSIVFVLIDFVFLWPENHFFALMALAAIASLTAIYELTVLGFSALWVTGVVVALFAVTGGIYFAVGPNLPEESVRSGWLVPANDPTPITGCNPAAKGAPILQFGPLGMGAIKKPTIVIPKDAAIVDVGSNGVILTKSDKAEPLIRVGECTLLSMQKTEDGILINSSVYDCSNKLIGNIKNNNFEGFENTHSHIEQGGNLSTLVIRDDSREQLWVRFLNPRAFQIRGKFIVIAHPGR